MTADPAAPDKAGALALFPALDTEAGRAANVVYSPASVEQAFGLLGLGAASETLAELERVLPLNHTRDQLAVRGEDVEVRVANALFLSDAWQFQSRFVTEAQDRFAATADRIDFADKAAAIARINGWAAEATEGLIQRVVDDTTYRTDTVALLANALYFDGKWANFFNGSEKRPFLFGDGQERDFTLVHEVLTVRTVDRDRWRAVRLPYRNDRFAMDVIMPARREVMAHAPTLAGIAAFADALAAEKPRPVEMRLPQFEVDYDAGLIPALTAAGLTLPFDRNRADLSRMIAPGQRRVYVDEVRHVAKLQVFDEGTRAAAVTTLRIVPVGRRLLSTPPIEFTVDRPFVFVIRDLETGAVLFLGRIAAPQAFEPEVEEPVYP